MEQRDRKAPPEPPVRLVVRVRVSLGDLDPQRAILCKRMSWMVAHTIARQLVSKVQHVNLIGALPHEAKDGFRWHW